MPIIIDPPVTPYSPLDDIRAWIEQLAEMRATAEDDDTRAAVDRATREAEDWLRMRRDRPLPSDLL